MKLPGTFATVCCGLILFAACKKSDSNNNMSAKGQMLVAGKWQMSAFTATLNYMGKDTTIDVYAQTDECDKDDFVLYYTNGKGTIDESANKCADDQQIENFSWMLLDNDTRLALVDSNPDTFDVEIANTQVKLQLIKPNSSGTPVTNVWTYKNIK